MPTPRKNESRKDFASRCIPVVKSEAEAKGEELTNAQAAGKCYGIYDSHKSSRAVSLSDRQSRVTSAFWALGDMWSHWPVAVYEDSLVTKTDDGRYFKFAYNWNDGEPTFDEAVEVERDFRGTPLAGQRRGGPIRLVEAEDGTETFECCIVRFTDEDEKDAYDTYFDKRTNFYLDWFETRPWLYEHAQHPKVGRSRAGTWTDVDVREDEGLFVTGELDRSHAYWKDFRTLIEHEVLYPSSGTLSYVMSVAEDGHVDDWPFIEGSSTITPADIGADAVQPVLRAYRSLEDTMTEEKKGFLARLFSNRTDEEQPEADEQETPVEEQDVAPAATDDEVRAAVVAVDAAVAENREGIVTVDTALRAVVERLDAVEALLRSVAETEAEKVQSSMKAGGFLESLWSATRSTDAPEASETPKTSIAAESDFGDAPDSPAARIAAESRRAR
jgi:hypothetical protein